MRVFARITHKMTSVWLRHRFVMAS